MSKIATNGSVAADIAKGWKPNNYLTNMSVAYFQPDDWFVSPFVFPILPVQLSTSYYTSSTRATLRATTCSASLSLARQRL